MMLVCAIPVDAKRNEPIKYVSRNTGYPITRCTDLAGPSDVSLA